MFLIQHAALMNLNGILLDQMGELYGFPKSMIGPTKDMVAGVVPVKDTPVVEKGNKTTGKKFLATTSRIILWNTPTLNITATNKGKGMIKAKKQWQPFWLRHLHSGERYQILTTRDIGNNNAWKFPMDINSTVIDNYGGNHIIHIMGTYAWYIVNISQERVISII